MRIDHPLDKYEIGTKDGVTVLICAHDDCSFERRFSAGEGLQIGQLIGMARNHERQEH